MGNAIVKSNFVVKNTTIFNPLDLICPHTCRGCGKLGSVLCECCKNYIKSSATSICPLCKQEFAVINKNIHKCPDCTSPLEQTFIVGWRQGALSKLIKDYKYKSVRACAPILAELLASTISENTHFIIIPLPTIGRHLRERGLDHTALLAKHLSRLRKWPIMPLLARAADTVQVGAKASERITQAQKAYQIVKPLNPGAHYLLLDDIWTTGSTILAATNLLKSAGALHVSAAILATTKPKEPQQIKKAP